VKNLLRFVTTILVLAALSSTTSFADGGNPTPDCPPQGCPVN